MASPKKARGIKRSSLMKVQRQLLLLRQLSHGPKSSEALIEAVNMLMLDAYPQAAREPYATICVRYAIVLVA